MDQSFAAREYLFELADRFLGSAYDDSAESSVLTPTYQILYAILLRVRMN